MAANIRNLKYQQLDTWKLLQDISLTISIRTGWREIWWWDPGV